MPLALNKKKRSARAARSGVRNYNAAFGASFVRACAEGREQHVARARPKVQGESGKVETGMDGAVNARAQRRCGAARARPVARATAPRPVVVIVQAAMTVCSAYPMPRAEVSRTPKRNVYSPARAARAPSAPTAVKSSSEG